MQKKFVNKPKGKMPVFVDLLAQGQIPCQVSFDKAHAIVDFEIRDKFAEPDRYWIDEYLQSIVDFQD